MVKTIYKKRFYKKSNDKYQNQNQNQNKIPESANHATHLIIVESPSKCKKIEEYLGSQYTCISSKGHIRNIKNGLKSIDIKNNYMPEYEILEEKREHVEWMKKIIAMFSKNNIILATDDDREGEAIAWHICMTFELDIETTPRIIFREITQVAIKTAIENPTHININIVNAQICRQVLDLLIGFKISPILWKHLYRNKENALSAGRCQTPAVKLIYENENEFNESITNITYKINGEFFQKNLAFHLSTEFENEIDVVNFLELSKTFSHDVSIGQKKESIKIPPKPFSTSALLQKASNMLGIGPTETMSICQQLYQDGLITYMRTESQKYSDVFLKKAKEYIIKRFVKQEYIGTLEDIINSNSNNPHEAIRVTNVEVSTIDATNSKMVSLYKLIWRNTVESCMSCAKYNNTLVLITAPMEHTYKYNVEVPIFLGFTKLIEDSKMNPVEEQSVGSGLLLYIQSSPNKNIKYNKITSTISLHGKKSHYTEASLIKKLEDIGIGRPSTYAMIIETILERGYVKKTDVKGITIKANEYYLEQNLDIKKEEKERTFGNETGKLIIQPLGMIVADFLYGHFSSLFSYDYTTKMEKRLDEIGQGQIQVEGEQWYKTCELCDMELMKLIKPIEKIEKQIFDIKDSEYKCVFEKYGPVLRKKIDDTYDYKKIKLDIKLDLEKLKKGEYYINELVEEKKENIIGEIDGLSVILKSGPYGEYIQHGDTNKSIKTLDIDSNKEIINGDEILHAFKEKQKDDINNSKIKIIRELTQEISIRNGKYGAYIHYKTEEMTKPKFLNIQKFKESYRYCSEEILLKWIKDTYNI
jgi:DNA topoisomerase-1